MAESSDLAFSAQPDIPLPGYLAEVVTTQAAERPEAVALTFIDADGTSVSQTYA